MPDAQVNGVKLHYAVDGPAGGVPLVIIQGFGSQMTSWPATLHEGLVANGHRVIRFDNRDVGLSQKFSGIPDARAAAKALAAGEKPVVPYTLADMADDVAALLDHLGVASAHVAGGSMGGMIAQLVALRHRPRVRSLISIFSTTSDPSLPRSSPEAQAALMAPPPSQSKDDVVAHTLKNRRVYASTAWPFDEAFWRANVSSNFDRAYFPEGQARQWAAIMATPYRTDALKALRVPTLVLHGTADVLIPPEAGVHTAQCIPGARLTLIEGWGHDMPPVFMPHLIAYISRFTADVEASRT
ncbi:MAG TPA: alpha/beta fold hydrolase [Micropepsaceae bacterium]|nr:alpha/beta fold hydrolase [Micropepsaceae bacterium]